jgi:hypothetical protein
VDCFIAKVAALSLALCLATIVMQTQEETVEYPSDAQHPSLGSRLVRTIGIVRAKAKIGLQNLVYNIRRLVILERNTAAAWASGPYLAQTAIKLLKTVRRCRPHLRSNRSR